VDFVIELFHGIEVLNNLLSVGCLIFLDKHGVDKANGGEGDMLIFFNIINESIPKLDKESVKKVKVDL
jgi:hypothetical protein